MLENIIIPNPKRLERIKSKIAKDGINKIHLISDFDRTLTTAFVNGREVPSITSILRKENYLSEDYTRKANALFDKYHPIEIDPKIPINEKKKAMHEWWITHFDLMVKSKLNIKDVEKVINSGKVTLREGALEFFDILKDYKIPLVIMSSSGLGVESISMYLKKEKRLYENVYIISNEFIWNKKGYATGVKKPIIHCMNKDETAIKKFPIFNIIKDRRNILLLGDSLGDIGMVKGFDYKKIIKIGFLNKNMEENIKGYTKAFDIIITHDSNMLYINNLLKELTT